MEHPANLAINGFYYSPLKYVALPLFYVDIDTITFDLYVEPVARGQKLASKAMKLLCEHLDHHGVIAKIIAEAKDDTWEPEDLVKFYEKFGFVKYGKSGVDTMIRLPKNG